MLELDFTNVLESAVGPNGIAQSVFQNAANSSKKLIDAVESALPAGALA